jgi:hypothetical protein
MLHDEMPRCSPTAAVRVMHDGGGELKKPAAS